MCGIIGYKGHRNAPDIVLECLKALEYRGYDSWGIVVRSNPGLFMSKKIGRIGGITSLNLPKGNIAIGHTRWATHGGVTERNAHPHLCNKNEIAVVHNGIIENYLELKEELKERGHVFISETDTEVIPHLINEYMKNYGFEEAVKLALKRLKGSYAIVVINRDSEKMIGAKNASPLVVGINDDEYFIASDAPAFVKHTKKVFFLDDGEMIVIEKKPRVVDIKTGRTVNKRAVDIGFNFEQALKGDYAHFMLKEICEQPQIIKELIKRNSLEDPLFLDRIKKMKLDYVERVVIVACGTSWHAGLVGEFMLETFAKLPVEVEYASEFRYRNPVIDDKTLVIAISQSGETADTLAAVKEAKSKGARVVSICNVFGSSIARESDFTLYTRAGPEIGVASTKAFTSQLFMLLLFSLYLGKLRKAVTDDKIEEAKKQLMEVAVHMQYILDNDKDILKCAEEYFNKTNALFLGRGVNFPVALEGALKLKEISYIHAEGYPAAEMKHGPIALIDRNMPVVFVATKDESYEKILGNIEEVKARGGIVIAVATIGDEEIAKKADHVFYVPSVRGILLPFLTVMPLQLLAYYIAVKRGCDVDKPRNLAKSVTVE